MRKNVPCFEFGCKGEEEKKRKWYYLDLLSDVKVFFTHVFDILKR